MRAAAFGRSLVLESMAAAVGKEPDQSAMALAVLRTRVPELSETAERRAVTVLIRPPWEGGFGVRGFGIRTQTVPNSYRD